MRPSDLLDIDDGYVAYCLDNAVWEFGSYVEDELGKVEGKDAKSTKARREATLKAILANDSAKKYADPAGKFK